MNEVWYYLISDGAVVQKQPYFEEGFIEGPYEVYVGYTYTAGVFSPPLPTYEQILESATQKLLYKQKTANTQISYLQLRIDTINDAVSMDMATDEEVAELPLRTTQLKYWKQYRVILGRMTQQPDWPNDPQWPLEPALYTTETNTSVSYTAV